MSIALTWTISCDECQKVFAQGKGGSQQYSEARRLHRLQEHFHVSAPVGGLGSLQLETDVMPTLCPQCFFVVLDRAYADLRSKVESQLRLRGEK